MRHGNGQFGSHGKAVGDVFHRIARDDFSCSGFKQRSHCVVGEYAMNADTNGCHSSMCPEQFYGFCHGSSARYDIVHYYRRPVGEFDAPGDGYGSIAASLLREDLERRVDLCGNLGNPLFAFFIGAKKDRGGDVRSDPYGDRSCCRNDRRVDRIDFAERLMPVQVWVASDQPVEGCRQNRSK